MAGHYTFTSPNDPSNYVSGGQPNTSSQMTNSHPYVSSIPYTTPSHISSYSTNNGVSNSGFPHAFPMTLPIQDSLYNAHNIQSPQMYSQHPGTPSAKWPPTSNPWASPMVAQGMGESWSNLSGMQSLNRQRPKLTTTLWEDENTVCFQVDAKGICVARRQDNDMVNGTKLLNVTGMSRGKRDGILKNEKGRVVVKVGAMHLKGVWITIHRAKALAAQFKIPDLLFPLLVDDPSPYLYSSHYPPGMPPPRMGSEPGGYVTTTFNDPTGSMRSQPQQHFMVTQSRMSYGSPVVANNDTHNPGAFPQPSQSRQYNVPYRYAGTHPHNRSPSMTHAAQGMESYMIPENTRVHSRSSLQGDTDHHEEPISGDTVAQPLVNSIPQQQQPLDYSTDNQYSRSQQYDMQQVRKPSEHLFGTNSGTIMNRKRNLSDEVDAESTQDGQFSSDPNQPHNGAIFAPLSGRNYSFPSPLTLSPCSLPSPSMTQIQHDMSPVNKRPKVLRYDSNSHSGYIDPYNQRLEHQTKPIAANGISTPAPMGQESLGLIFGTLSPPESETEGYIDQVHQANGEHSQPRCNGDGNRFPFVNSIKQTS